MKSSEPDVTFYAQEALRFLDSARNEYQFRHEHGDYGIRIGWELTAGDMLIHIAKAEDAVKAILGLMEAPEELIGTKLEEDSNLRVESDVPTLVVDSPEDAARRDYQELYPEDEELVTGVGPGGYERYD